MEFVWRVSPGVPGPDGVRALLDGEPAGEGTYRIYRDVPFVLDVPAGMQVIQDGFYSRHYYRRPPPPDAPRFHVRLVDADTGSALFIDPDTGREINRVTTSPDVDALFDQIVASIRRVEVASTPAPTPVACTHPTAADCIRAVYLGAPGDYAQVAAIPAAALLTTDADGRYHVERGQQVTVVTAAPLPAGWTRFWLDWSPLEFGTPSPLSFSQLIQPVGTTYTFTPTADEAASTLITFDLTAARPFIRPRPDGKPELGDVVVTTVFSVETTSPRYNSYDTTGAVATAGSYAFIEDPADTTSAVTTYEALRGVCQQRSDSDPGQRSDGDPLRRHDRC